LKSTIRAIAIVLLGLHAPPTQEGQFSVTELPFETVRWNSTELPASFIAGTTVCEIDSEVYVRLFKESQLWTASPITLLHQTGKVDEIDLRAAAEDGQDVIATVFNVDKHGNVYVAIQVGTSDQWYLAIYANDGRFLRKIKLPGGLVPSFLVPIENSRFVIGGVKSRTTAEESHTTSLVALLDKEGAQIKSLSLPDDDEHEEATKTVGKYVTYSVLNPTIEHGRAVVGPDGDVYIFRASPEPTVQILDSYGNPLRVISLATVTQDLLPSNFYIFDDAIAVGYELTKENFCPVKGFFALYSRQSGRLLANYSIPLAPKILLCAQNHSLFYLKASPGDKTYQMARIQVPTTKP
jgi:hypothetical protein